LGQLVLTGLLCVLLFAGVARAAPYAAMVMDARTGEVIHARNADTRLHPASLTKMMTLYIAFEAIEHGEISLDSLVTISRKAAAEPPSKLGLRPGQRIKLRYLIRAAAIKSANDAATAIGEAIEGSEAAFARRMNRTAKALGMTRTTFKNANGLTEAGHLSTARDMTILGRHLIYDYPEYYNLFSRRVADAGIRKVASTNRRFLSSYPGADGIKTGYTAASGFNLVASAKRGSKRIIATVFGGRSSASRNAEVARLLDLGFRKAPSRVALRKPKRPPYGLVVKGPSIALLTKSPRPVLRPGSTPEVPADVIMAVAEDVATEVAEVRATVGADGDARPLPEGLAVAIAASPRPSLRDAPPETPTMDADRIARAVAEAAAGKSDSAAPTEIAANVAPEITLPPGPEIVTRASTSGGRNWGISIGLYPSRFAAERALLTTALREIETLDTALRKVARTPRGFEANFVGMTEATAELACSRLQAQATPCEVLIP